MENTHDMREKILGIVVEYNPLHKGHLFHLDQSISKSAASGVIAVMSGNFVQRGEPAIVDKFDRTYMALKSGVNLVLEIPAIYAVQDAGGFACGAIGILERSGVVTDLVFGSESSELEMLDKVADLIVSRKNELNVKEKTYMKKGFSYPNARKYSLKEMICEECGHYAEGFEETISKSNDILGLEYLRWMRIYESGIVSGTVKRVGSNYNDDNFNGEFSSASAIRKMALNGDWDNLIQAVPELTGVCLEKYRSLGGFFTQDDLREFFFVFLLARNRDHLKKYYGITEGMEKRFADAVKSSDGIDDMLESVKSKRVTYSRLKRTLLYMLFEIDGKMIKDSEYFGPQYIRVLGFDRKGRDILSKMRNAAVIPIISTPSSFNQVLRNYRKALKEEIPYFFDERVFRAQLEMDFRMSDFYYHMLAKKHGVKYVSEIKRPPIIIM